MLFKERFLKHQELEQLHGNTYELQCGGWETEQCECLLSRPWGDGDADFPAISYEVMRILLEPFEIVTHVWSNSYHSPPKKQQKAQPPQNHFTAKYYDTRIQNADHGLFCDGERHLVSLTHGMDLELMDELLKPPARPIWSSDNFIYGYQALPLVPACIDAWLEAVEHHAYSIYMEYREQHDGLLLRFLPQAVDRELVLRTVQTACNAHGKVLKMTVLDG